MEENGRAVHRHFQVSRVSIKNIILIALSGSGLQVNHPLHALSY